MQIDESIRKTFSAFLVAHVPLLSRHIDPANRPKFCYGFGVGNSHFRAVFSKSEINNGFNLVFEETAYDVHPIHVSCALAKNGELVLITAKNTTPEYVEKIFETFMGVVLHSRVLL